MRNPFSKYSLSLHLQLFLHLLSFCHLHLLPSFTLNLLLIDVDQPLDLLDFTITEADGFLEGVDSKVAPGLVFLNFSRLS